ncbi:MAG: preprotein translocase subunit SecA [Candidatus Moranbacteria bacterium]|nr:preprotein translocase subunit SecA [Candidatus Moranbacteria bacterium]
MKFIEKLFGNSNNKELERMRKTVEQVNELEAQFKNLSDEQIKEKTEELKKRAQDGESLENLLPEAFANAREAASRTIGERHYDVQLLGAIALHEGKIAEMKTGEGKTLASTAAAYLNALTGKGSHIVTVNDYLSKRDANWMGRIYHFLGLSVGCITHDASFLYKPKVLDDNEVSIEMENLESVERKEAYAADITYGTNNEFGFDYLRDNMAKSLDDMAQGELNFAVVDEVDSILIDEARTPLIISAPDNESTQLYQKFAQLVPGLKEGEDYNVDEKMKSADLTQEGITKIEKWLGIDNLYETGRAAYVHHLEQALRAHVIFQNDKDYVVREGEIVIVDDFTGRLMPGRRYSEGLHQAIEAKEGVQVQRESKTLASITFQNFFRMYDKLSGMTGTAITSAEEFSRVYELEVMQIPTNEPMIRQDLSDMIFKTEKGKFKSIARKIKELHKEGRPVLVGTVAIEKSEALSEILAKEGVPHEVLNAKNHEKEAQIISNAGEKGSVTIATNMAGRGTDIKLGEGVKELRGLYIIGTERHEARRIDNQLRGRSGRQGDPGTSQFYVSLEDELLRRFGGEKMYNIMGRLGLPEDQPIENKMISRSIESAQSKIEGHNFDIRKHVLEYDDVVNKQREVVYSRRKKILEKESLENDIQEIIKEEAEGIVSAHTSAEIEDYWNTEEMMEEAKVLIGDYPGLHQKLLEIKKSKEFSGSQEKKGKMSDHLAEIFKNFYQKKKQDVGEELFKRVEKELYLMTVDNYWMQHLEQLSYLRDSVNLKGYGQRDPLIEYKKEAFQLFQNLLAAINRDLIKSVFRVQPSVQSEPGEGKAPGYDENRLQYSGGERPEQFKQAQANNPSGEAAPQKPVIRDKKVGRNDACPCGSGKKYKKCCYPKYE